MAYLPHILQTISNVHESPILSSHQKYTAVAVPLPDKQPTRRGIIDCCCRTCVMIWYLVCFVYAYNTTIPWHVQYSICVHIGITTAAAVVGEGARESRLLSLHRVEMGTYPLELKVGPLLKKLPCVVRCTPPLTYGTCGTEHKRAVYHTLLVVSTSSYSCALSISQRAPVFRGRNGAFVWASQLKVTKAFLLVVQSTGGQHGGERPQVSSCHRVCVLRFWTL